MNHLLEPDRRYDRFMNEFDEVMKRAYEHSAKAGFWNGYEDHQNFPTKLLLMVSEIIESFEDWRGQKKDERTLYYLKDGKPEGIYVELADVIIRIMDMAYRDNIPLARLILVKMAYNETRPHMHGGKRV